MRVSQPECLGVLLSSCSNASSASHVWFAVTYCDSLKSVVASREDTPFVFCGFRSWYGGKTEMLAKM